MRNTLVRVFDTGGRAIRGARVSFEVHQFLASGFTPDQYTNPDGEAEFDLNIDESAEVTLYVNGSPVTRRAQPRGAFRVEL